MNDQRGMSFDQQQRLHRVLVGYLDGLACPTWPGADGLTVDDVVGCYPRALAAGLVPGLDDLIRKHPDLTEELNCFFRYRTDRP